MRRCAEDIDISGYHLRYNKLEIYIRLRDEKRLEFGGGYYADA
jgi:hypothetical protein